MNLFDFFKFFSLAHSEIAENGADKVLSSEEENPSVHKTYVNFPTSRKSALNVPLYAISILFSFFCRGLQMCRNFLTTCTTLGTRGKKLQADAALCGRIAKNGADAKPCLSDVYKSGTRARRRQADATLCGRSMVEMLGVLAIIGVLSVGAISGYSKAMMKYKLNKQTEQLNTLTAAIIQYRHEFQNITTFSNLNSFFIKLGLIPENMDKGDTNYLYDVFNNRINITSNGLQNDGTLSSIGINYVIDTSAAFEVCQNIYQTAQGFADDLFRIVVVKSVENVGTSYSNSFYGKKYCNTNRKCLAKVSIADIHEACQFCKESKSCGIWFSVYINS